MKKHYGTFKQVNSNNEFTNIAEEIKYTGFSIVEEVYDSYLMSDIKSKLLRLNDKQNSQFGEKYLDAIQEKNQIRLPFVKDRIFMEIFKNNKLKKILDTLFKPTKSFYVLNQQNAIINLGNEPHNQSSWHRDFPYIHGVSNIKQAYSVLIAVDDFTKKNGGTRLVPFTHMYEEIPSWKFIEKNFISVKCKAGSAIFFDSQIFHSAGINSTKKKRIAINNVFSNPTYRQQIQIPTALEDAGVNEPKSKYLRQLFGYESKSPISDEDFKHERLKRKS